VQTAGMVGDAHGVMSLEIFALAEVLAEALEERLVGTGLTGSPSAATSSPANSHRNRLTR